MELSVIYHCIKCLLLALVLEMAEYLVLSSLTSFLDLNHKVSLHAPNALIASFCLMIDLFVVGPCAMENNTFDITEDISATMMRRARCLHVARYSTDASSNLEMISREIHTIRTERNLNGNLEYTSLISSCEQLWRLWSWIDRVEQLCARKEKDINIAIDERRLPAKGLHDAGLLSLLRMNKKDTEDVSTFDKSTLSPHFNRKIFDSPMRR